MTEALRVPRPWFTFTGCVLVVAVLFWAQAVIVPIAFAVLMSFVLTPVVSALERAIGRVPAVIAVVALVSASSGLLIWLVTQQLASLVEEIPGYQHNIHQKIVDVRGASTGGSLETLQRAVEKIGAELGIQPPDQAAPVVV